MRFIQRYDIAGDLQRVLVVILVKQDLKHSLCR